MKRMFKALCIAASLTVAAVNVNAGEYKDNNILISAEEAFKLIGKENVMFVSGDSEDIYKLGHIKGSVSMYAHHIHHSDIMGEMECAPLYQCIEDAEHYIGSKGIDNDTMIIAYDDFKGPNATGVYSFFKSYGHDNIKVLNGGRSGIIAIDPEQKIYNKIKAEYKAEKKIGKKAKKKLKKFKKGKITLTEAQVAEYKQIMKVSKKKQKAIKKRMDAQAKNLMVIAGEEHIAAKKYHIDEDAIDLSNIADKHELLHAVKDIQKNGKDSKYVIIDARGMAEIIGERKMDNVARGGHIPGSVFMEWKKTSDLDNKKSFKSADELKAAFEHYGITPDKTVYAYCMVGAGRGSQQVTAMQLIGYKNVKVFTGSWDVWGNSMNFPVKK